MMTIEALRKQVKAHVDNADENLLKRVLLILEDEMEQDEVDGIDVCWDELPARLQAMIDAGIKEGEEGNRIPDEEVMKEFSKWFKK